MTHIGNPATWEAETRGLQVQGQPKQHSETLPQKKNIKRAADMDAGGWDLWDVWHHVAELGDIPARLELGLGTSLDPGGSILPEQTAAVKTWEEEEVLSASWILREGMSPGWFGIPGRVHAET